MKKRLGPSERLYPMPCPLVVGGTAEESDLMAVAWINVVASTPPSIAMGLRRTRHTLELIQATGEFTVNVPSTSMAAVVDYCGLVSGRAHDKATETGLTLVPSAVVGTPIVDECPYNLECRVTHEHPIGEYILIVGEIVESHAEETILDESGDKVDVTALDPLVYIAGSREYRGLTAKLADAFALGKTIAPKPEPAEE